VNRAYLVLFVTILALGAALALLSRLPRHEAPRPTPPRAALPAAISLTLDAVGAIVPERSTVSKGSEVTLTVSNQGRATHVLSLAGYEAEVHLAVPAGRTARAVFRADRPGDDFAWLVDGVPAARLAVGGSHLVEGHQ